MNIDDLRDYDGSLAQRYTPIWFFETDYVGPNLTDQTLRKKKVDDRRASVQNGKGSMGDIVDLVVLQCIRVPQCVG